jgi:hypothetical protein
VQSDISTPEFTFKQRVAAFWTWYAGVAERFHRHFEGERDDGLAAAVSDKVDELLPGMAWVFGPGGKPGEHSFTLTGEGIPFKQMLARYWLRQAPEIEGWCFHAERMAYDEPGEFSLRFDKLVFKVMEFWVTPEVDQENECLDLTVWHPLADQIDKGHCQTALFLVLDEIFGETGTGRWIGGMEFSRTKLGPSMPILELKEFLEATRADRGWKFIHPCDTYTGYRIPPEKQRNQLRFDTIAGTSRGWEVLCSYFEETDGFSDPFRKVGAGWVYLTFPSSMLPAGRQVDARGEIEEAIEDALAAERSGLSLGGAIGTRHAYLDFLVFDGERSLAIIREAARNAGVPAETRLEFLDSRSSGRPLFPAS